MTTRTENRDQLTDYAPAFTTAEGSPVLPREDTNDRGYMYVATLFDSDAAEWEYMTAAQA